MRFTAISSKTLCYFTMPSMQSFILTIQFLPTCSDRPGIKYGSQYYLLGMRGGGDDGCELTDETALQLLSRNKYIARSY